MEGSENKDGYSADGKNEIFSKPVRAGKRTYFFDVKSTKGNDYYLTITESKKRMGEDGKFFYEKHKLFLYKEDFDKFAEGLSEVVAYIKNARPAVASETNAGSNGTGSGYSSVNFEDLK
ncbi:MAG: PUR family DNA/RNA-binding protein [Bacteroidia bacterium]|nr:PUR family DNA/RNA-binding protein [Bacteroidia bacterium]